MDSKSVLRIEPKHSGFLVFKGGGSAELAYACTTLDDVKALIDETYDKPTGERMLPELSPEQQALIARAENDDIVTGLNNAAVGS